MASDLLILLGILLLIFIVVLYLNSQKRFAEVSFGDVKIKAEVADTAVKQAKGLMFRKGLAEDEGMIFVFNKEDYHTFWMMNTSIPLDIIWVSSDKEIVHIVEDAKPCFIGCELYRPDEKAKYVVEVNAGFVKKHGIEVGNSMGIRN